MKKLFVAVAALATMLFMSCTKEQTTDAKLQGTWTVKSVDVKLYEQNEDDAIYNRVTLLAEERIACAVTDLKGVYLLEAE